MTNKQAINMSPSQPRYTGEFEMIGKEEAILTRVDGTRESFKLVRLDAEQGIAVLARPDRSQIMLRGLKLNNYTLHRPGQSRASSSGSPGFVFKTKRISFQIDGKDVGCDL